MPETVSRDSIDMRVVKSWQGLMEGTADDKGDDLSTVEPFNVRRGVTYKQVMEEVNAGSSNGLDYYRLMVQFTPGYTFRKI